MGWQARLKVDYSVEDQRCVARQRICSTGREAGLSKRLNRKDPILSKTLETLPLSCPDFSLVGLNRGEYYTLCILGLGLALSINSFDAIH